MQKIQNPKYPQRKRLWFAVYFPDCCRLFAYFLIQQEMICIQRISPVEINMHYNLHKYAKQPNAPNFTLKSNFGKPKLLLVCQPYAPNFKLKIKRHWPAWQGVYFAHVCTPHLADDRNRGSIHLAELTRHLTSKKYSSNVALA